MKLLNWAALLVLALAMPLAGCVTLGEAVTAVQTVYQKVTAYYADAPKTVYTLRGGYDIALGAAAAFKTSQCPAVTSHSYCATVIPVLRKGNHQALAALDAAESFVRTHPTLDATAVIDAAQKAVEAFAKLETSNGVPAP